MIRQDESQFNDPSLRAALRRSFGEERAPLALREAVARTLNEGWDLSIDYEQPSTVSIWRDRWERWHSLVYSGVAACVMIFGVAFLVLAYLGYFDARPSYSYAPPPPLSVPSQVVSALVARHHGCEKLHDHHLIAGNDPAAVKLALEAQLGFAVAAMDPGNGWEFKGAGKCVVGSTPAAHLLFSRGTQEISVFSLPASGVRQVSTTQESFAADCERLPIAGTVRGAGMYAVVGSSTDESLSIYDVVALRDQFLTSIPDAEEQCLPESQSFIIAHTFLLNLR